MKSFFLNHLSEIKKYYLKLLSLLLIPFSPKLYILLPFLLRRRISFINNQNLITIRVVLIFLIAYITSYHLINFSAINLFTLQCIAPFSIFLLFSFIQYDLSFLRKFRNCVYIVFYLDLITNIISVLFDINIHLEQVNYFNSLYHSLVGLYGHPYISISISIVTFFYATLFKDKKIQLLSFGSLFFVSSLRSLLFLYPIIIAYRALSKGNKFSTLITSLFFGFILIFFYVKYDSNYAEAERCKILIQTNTYGFCENMNSSSLRLYAWSSFLREFPDFHILGSLTRNYNHDRATLTPQIIEEDKIFESPYFQYIHDYGFIFFFAHIYLFLYMINVNQRKYSMYNQNSFNKRLFEVKTYISSLYFFDSFYGVFFYTPISLLTMSLILFFKEDETQ